MGQFNIVAPMAQISRLVVPGHPHHVTQKGVRSIPIFSNDNDCNLYLAIIAKVGVLILVLGFLSSVALPVESATHADIADHLAKTKGNRNTDALYGGVAPDSRYSGGNCRT